MNSLLIHKLNFLSNKTICIFEKGEDNWPAPPTIHRGLEWPQCLNCLFVCLFVCLLDCLFWANFLIFLLLILLFYSILLCYWPAPPTIHRGLEWPQCLNCLFSVCLIVCLFSVCLWANFLILLLILLFYSSVSCVIGPLPRRSTGD